MIAYLVLMALGLLVLVESLGMPAATLEPLGPRAFPLCLGLLLILLASVGLFGLVRARRTAGGKVAVPGSEAPTGTGAGVLGGSPAVLYVALLSGLYIYLLEQGPLGFALTSALYLFLVMAAFSTRRPLEIAAMAVFALGLGFTLEFVFTEILFIDIASFRSPVLAARA